jgi:hypothetical protein
MTLAFSGRKKCQSKFQCQFLGSGQLSVLSRSGMHAMRFAFSPFTVRRSAFTVRRQLLSGAVFVSFSSC